MFLQKWGARRDNKVKTSRSRFPWKERIFFFFLSILLPLRKYSDRLHCNKIAHQTEGFQESPRSCLPRKHEDLSLIPRMMWKVRLVTCICDVWSQSLGLFSVLGALGVYPNHKERDWVPLFPSWGLTAACLKALRSWGVAGNLLTAQDQKGSRLKPQDIPGKGLCIELLGLGMWEGAVVEGHGNCL